jgi:hypothetical protein
MRLSIDWLADHVDLGGLAPAELGELFTLHVAEVDPVVAISRSTARRQSSAAKLASYFALARSG